MSCLEGGDVDYLLVPHSNNIQVYNTRTGGPDWNVIPTFCLTFFYIPLQKNIEYVKVEI